MQRDEVHPALSGSLPEEDFSRIRVVELPKPTTPRGGWRKHQPKRKRWTRAKIAKYVGVSTTKLVRLLKRCVRAQRLLGLQSDCSFPRGRDTVDSDKCVRAAAQLLVDIMERDAGRWSKRYPRCRTCGTTSVKHASKGICNSCSSVRKRRRAGMALKQPFKGKAWDPVHGLVACLICHRTKHKHRGGGRCAPCLAWHCGHGRFLSEREYVAAVTRKRISLNTPWRGVVARDVKTGVETTFTVRRGMKDAGFNITLVEKCLRGMRETHNGCMFRHVDE